MRSARVLARAPAWAFVLSLVAAFSAAPSSANPGTNTNANTGASRAQAIAVLNRVAFGPTPADVQHVMQIGVKRYIAEQLQPGDLALPPELQQSLNSLDALQKGPAQLIQEFRAAQQAVKADPSSGRQERKEFLAELSQQAARARISRAIASPRQLEEVMVDFWFNHFNVYAGKGLDRALVANYEREAIRPYVFGHFRDLLGATAHHPAMLFYLDNWLSSAAGYRPLKAQGPLGKASGLNENYARELMELHTLGVDGGYTQKDVTELARMFTGWTINPRLGDGSAAFYFDARRHDPRDKEWLGRHVAARGQAEGEWALDVLAAHPATARHIGYELAQYFVDDRPPPALVERLAGRFLATDGDLRAVLKTLFDSDEFARAMEEQRKFKTPYQYLMSALRAAQVHEFDNVRPVLLALQQMGMPLYGCQTPDGYKNVEEAWLNADALSKRVSFATLLTSGRMNFSAVERGTTAANAAASAADTPLPLEANDLEQLFGDTLSARTKAALDEAPPRLRAAMILGGPDFMRR